MALRELCGDVHYEGGASVREGAGVENFVWAERFTIDGKLLEASEKATLVAECGSVVMVGMTRFPIRNDDSARAELADGSGEAELVLARRLDVGIRNTQRASVLHFEDFCGGGSFLGTCFGRAACAHFSGSEVENAGLVAGLRHFEQCAAAGEFDVVGMSGDGEKVEVHGGSG